VSYSTAVIDLTEMVQRGETEYVKVSFKEALNCSVSPRYGIEV